MLNPTLLGRRAQLALAAAAILYASPALANPRPLPFTYQHEQLAEGASEVEQFVDYTHVRASNANTGDPVWYGLTQFTTEFEHGISRRLELGLYVTMVPGAANGFAEIPRGTQGNGLKQRLRYQLAPTGVWPIDLGVYGELAENEREIEIEAKLILQRRFDKLRLVANLEAEQEFYFDGNRDFVAKPSVGITYEVSPAVQPGFEWWMAAEFPERNPPSPRPFTLGPHQYVGPALLLQFGSLWWTTGLYARISDLGHTLQVGEPYGNFWVRTVIGIGL